MPLGALIVAAVTAGHGHLHRQRRCHRRRHRRPPALVLMVVAAVFLLTSVVSFCPLHRLVGLSSCRTGR
ncbi:MAG: DUF2892 domain-containing protein [Sphingomonadales bacterium]|nr:DUF2892 domain-containing protein [Sphingomonadales bacterium]